MRRTRLLWRLSVWFVAIALAGLFGVGWVASYLEESLSRTQLRAGGAVAIISTLAIGFGWIIHRRVSQPLREMRDGVQRFASGNLGQKLRVPQTLELAELAEALNGMAEHLEERIAVVVRQGKQQEAVLEGMVESVIAVDINGRVISLNNAAAQLFKTDRVAAMGKTIGGVVRNAQVQEFVTQTLQSETSIEADIDVRGERDRYLNAHGAVLRDENGETSGAVVVLNDVTNFHRLENMRRDFVANVSHELKTPIASIKGFVETLLDGALDDRDDAERFLRIVARQGDRLNLIIEDLLSLAKIEQSEETGGLEMEVCGIRAILVSSSRSITASDPEKHVNIVIDCDDRVRGRVNPQLLEQAVINLLQNAVKYSEHDGEVRIVAKQDDGEITIAVEDQGCGIAADHLPRIFERFYRVDKARSRRLGGTGLGLAIVKHVVYAHGGQVSVESTPGSGSTFTIRLNSN